MYSSIRILQAYLLYLQFKNVIFHKEEKIAQLPIQTYLINGVHNDRVTYA